MIGYMKHDNILLNRTKRMIEIHLIVDDFIEMNEPDETPWNQIERKRKKMSRYHDSNEQSRTELRVSRWGKPSTKGDEARYLKYDVE